MEKRQQLYEGKAKKVFATDDPDLLIVEYKDDATAFNGLKRGTIEGKGVINNRMSNRLMQRLERAGIPTHFVRELSERETLVKSVEIVPLEVIVRNTSAGSFSKRYGVSEASTLTSPRWSSPTKTTPWAIRPSTRTAPWPLSWRTGPRSPSYGSTPCASTRS